MNFVTTPRELSECDREPIHNIATVQSFGGLIKLNSDWSITHRSLNVADLLGLKALPAIGLKLHDLFEAKAIDALRNALAGREGHSELARVFGLQLTASPATFDCALHTVDNSVVIEFEPHNSSEFENHVSLLAPMLAQLEGLGNLTALCAKAAKLVRQTLGYDRVMIYRFHADETGEVIAEDAREDLEPYLGLRYPHTDIPKQARELFQINRVRIIADVDSEASAIEPPVAFGNRPLDMTMSVLRTSSQIHLRYHENMGVRATMTLAIVRQGKLWGLISCHHTSPRLPSFSLRTVAESIGQVFSLVLDRMLIERSERLRSRGLDLHQRLITNIDDNAQLGAKITVVADLLDDLIAHDGLSVNVGGDFVVHGASPTKEEFESIAPDLSVAPLSQAYGTTRLADHFPVAEKFAEKAAGALLIPISRDPYDYLILWRKPLSQKVRWAGDPSKAKSVGPGERLQPRESFAEWTETVKGRSEDWTADDLHIAEGLRITLLEVILRMSEEVARERNRAQEQQALLIAELNHRVRNILNLIRSLVSQSQQDAVDVESFARIIGGRIASLASAHDNITKENWAPAPLATLFESEIEAYLTSQADRFTLTGDQVLIAPEAYTVLALVVHELMTNSAKYGSLCDQSGSVRVEVSRRANGDLDIAWRERGGPPVQPPTRRGFGSTLIERSIPFELKGEAKLSFKLTGLEADFVIPARFVAVPPKDRQSADNEPRRAVPKIERNHQKQSASKDSDGLPGHVLVIEDSMIIALDIEENLKRQGVASIDVTSSVLGALSAIETREPDLAIVDFNLGKESSAPAIEELKRRGVLFVVATGYAEMGEEIGEIGAMGVVRKPYGHSEIEDVLQAYKAVITSTKTLTSQKTLL